MTNGGIARRRPAASTIVIRAYVDPVVTGSGTAIGRSERLVTVQVRSTGSPSSTRVAAAETRRVPYGRVREPG
jgi:hypothetical protein